MYGLSDKARTKKPNYQNRNKKQSCIRPVNEDDKDPLATLVSAFPLLNMRTVLKRPMTTPGFERTGLTCFGQHDFYP
jgi:hypothetical protein